MIYIFSKFLKSDTISFLIKKTFPVSNVIPAFGYLFNKFLIFFGKSLVSKEISIFFLFDASNIFLRFW